MLAVAFAIKREQLTLTDAACALTLRNLASTVAVKLQKSWRPMRRICSQAWGGDLAAEGGRGIVGGPS